MPLSWSKFTDGKLACKFADGPGGTLAGTLTFNGQQFSSTAHASGEEFEGTFTSGAVIFDRADANKAEWDKLTSPTATAAPVLQPEEASKVLGTDAQVYQFPDGTGSISLAAGWKTQAPSAIGPIFILGPKDQNIAIGNILSIKTPDSPLMKMIEHNEAMMRRMGGNPPARAPMLVAEFTDPVQAMTDLGPQINKISEARGGPTGHLDKILTHQEIPCDLRPGL